MEGTNDLSHGTSLLGSNWECELQFKCSENKKCESDSTDVPQFETQGQVTSRSDQNVINQQTDHRPTVGAPGEVKLL
jgi:hypothetical protein